MQMLLKTLEEFTTKNTIEVPLNPIGSWAKTTHAVEKNDLLAMIAGLGSERAVLLTGDPGVGKSNLARVAANLTNRFFISTVIKPDDEIGDLLWKIDHVQRLSDAQLAAAKEEEFIKSLKEYIRPGPIWHAFKQPPPELTSEYVPPDQKANRKNGVVLLLDEIDKASVSLLNSLLEVLGNMSFEVPLYDEAIECREKPPLIILTSNGDRELPEPLLRRCVCHTVSLPMTHDAFIQRMCVIAKAKKGEKYSEKVAIECAELIYSHRRENQYSSGASEFVDLINTLDSIAPNDEDAQIKKHLSNIKQYFLKS